MVIVTETRYFRSDTQAVNRLTAYKFAVVNTTTPTSVTHIYPSLPVDVMVLLYRRSPDGSETPIFIPVPSTLTFTTPTRGMFSSSFTAFPTTFELGDSLVVKVFMRGYMQPYFPVAIFTTTHIGSLQASYLTCYLYLDVSSTKTTFIFGSSEYPSRMEGLTYNNIGLDPMLSEAPGCLSKI